MLGGGARKVWVPFKYESLLAFCFRCGKIGHGVRDYDITPDEEFNRPGDTFPYSVALKAKTNVRGRECYGFAEHKMKPPKIYVGKKCGERVALVISTVGEIDLGLKSTTVVSQFNKDSTVVLRSDKDKIDLVYVSNSLVILEQDNGQHSNPISEEFVERGLADRSRAILGMGNKLDKDPIGEGRVDMEHDGSYLLDGDLVQEDEIHVDGCLEVAASVGSIAKK